MTSYHIHVILQFTFYCLLCTYSNAIRISQSSHVYTTLRLKTYEADVTIKTVENETFPKCYDQSETLVIKMYNPINFYFH